MSLFDSYRANTKPPKEEERVLRVAELNRAVRGTLEGGFSDIWVEGEIAQCTKSAPGHVYFTLVDETEPAQLSCVMFRSDAMRARAKLETGARVRVRGRATLYVQSGRFQLAVTHAMPAGAGDQAARLEALRKKLDAEGLFATARKRSLPRLPRVVGVVTSTSGAALHDILEVSRSRCPVRVVVADCRVQGVDAPRSIVAALAAIQRLPEVEVVIVARGGGSSEDLAAFQDESVVRAIAACRVPIVSAVGHETDVTLSDFAADLRAATPSNAAELVVPDRRMLESALENGVRRLERAMDGYLDGHRLELERRSRKLEDPRTALASARRRLDEQRTRLAVALPRRIAKNRASLVFLDRRLFELDPRRKLAERRMRLFALEGRLRPAMHRLVQTQGSELAELAAKLDALSPLAVLTRGYAIALDADGRAVRRARDVKVGDALTLRLGDGRVRARAEAIEDEST